MSRTVAFPHAARRAVFSLLLVLPATAGAQGPQRAKADALFNEGRYSEAMPLYSQLVSLAPSDPVLNYRFGATLLFVGEDKGKAIGHLKYATGDPAIPAPAWYWLGRAYHLNYRFKDALDAYQRFRARNDKKALAELPVDALEEQCRNGRKLLSKLKDVTVRNKVEVADREFFRFYDLSDIGGRIVVTPDELKTPLDKKNKLRGLVYLPDQGGPIHFSSYGKDGRTGLDIYRTELLPDGRFATPVKLSGEINTDQDEDYAFLHPDGRTFYFSSKGHNSMGGYDVFRAAWDAGTGTFGQPENMDFAVNTPDDDIFYVTDPEHKEACFASGRDSRQGKLHVYRVSTVQTPVTITVLKGVYLNGIETDDRKARIVVEDALSREQVSEARTDVNGGYVISLPRGGRFRFLVDCGPSGMTHMGLVEVPRATNPRAYRQELHLITDEDGREKLLVRNFFEEAVEEDLIELAFDEIKRRSRLDVTDERSEVRTQPPQGRREEESPIVRAGLPADMDEMEIKRVAKEDAHAWGGLATDLESWAAEAFGVSVEAAAEAEREARRAETLVGRAAQETDEGVRDAAMADAARHRQRAREATLRARAAYRAGQDLEAERDAARQKASDAEELAANLEKTLGTGKDEEAIAHLVMLRERLDARRAAGGSGADVAERFRRAASEQGKEAERALARASSGRTEETEAIGRLNRLRRERTETKSRSRQEQLDREIAEQEGRIEVLHREAEEAFVKARGAEREAAVKRGQASLVRHLADGGTVGPGSTLTREQTDKLGQNIATTDMRIGVMSIDDRYDLRIAPPPSEVEARVFSWDPAQANRRSDLGVTGQPDPGQRTTRPDGGADGERATDGDLADGPTAVRPGGGIDAAGRDERPDDGAPEGDRRGTRPGGGVDGAADGERATDGDLADGPTAVRPGGGIDAAGRDERPDDGAPEGDRRGTRPGGGVDGAADGERATDGALADGQRAVRPSGGSDGDGADRRTVDGTPVTGPKGARLGSGSDGEGSERSSAGAGGDGTPLRAGEENDTRAPDPRDVEPGSASERFLVENERAELRQLEQAERNRSRRDSISARIAELDARLADIESGTTGPEEEADGFEDRYADLSGPVDMSRIPLVFDRDAKDDDIIRPLFRDYVADKDRLVELRDADERAAGLHGLELMLADSLRAEMVRQVAVLELDPQQADRILPRVERLRRMREEHLLRADEVLSERQDELAAAGTGGGTGEAKGEGARPPVYRTVGTPGSGAAPDPINDHFVVIEGDPREVFASEVHYRSKTVDDAVAFKEADLLRMESLSRRIDSLELAVAGKSRKEQDRLRKNADRLRDERLIIRSDLGQRSAFLSREEWRTANDSLKRLDRDLVRRGLPPSEPLVLMAQGMKSDAQHRFEEAGKLRRTADRTEDIIARDSLYRSAYELELRALRGIDRAITVTNHMLGQDHARGSNPSYEEVAAKVLGIDRRALEDRPLAVVPPLLRDSVAEGDEGDVAGRTAGEDEDTRTVVDIIAEEEPTEANTAEEAGDEVPEQPFEEAVARAEALTRARADAEEQARSAEEGLAEEARRPAATYERFLDGATAGPLDRGSDEDAGTRALRERAERATEEAAAMERRSIELADRATALRDSAATAKKRERFRLEQLAARERATSDSLHAASLAKAGEARIASDAHLKAEEAGTFRRRLMKYYYLSEEEMDMIAENADRSRYFQARARAMEQHDAADEAGQAAQSNRELGALLARQADGAAKAPDATAPDRERARVLAVRASALMARADSLDNVAARLRGAAGLNEGQASVMLQGLPEERSSELMALEMRNRRTERLLAEARGQAGAQPRTVVADRGTGMEDDAPATRVDDTAFLPPRTLTRDIFELRPAAARRAAPIPLDQQLPEGIVFKVQIGAFRRPVPQETFSDMAPVNGETTESGLVRYTAGLFTALDQANTAKDKVRDRGYRDAFVVAYINGRRVSLAEARRMAEARPAVDPAPSATPPPTIQPDGRIADRPEPAPAEREEPAADGLPPPTALNDLPLGTPPERRREPSPTIIIRQQPAPPAADPDDAAEVLANYPATAREIVARFTPAPEATTYYNVPGAAPAEQVEAVRGLFFTVQVGVYSRPVSLDKLYNVQELNSERTETGMVRYTSGRFPSLEQARVRKDDTVARGVKDAFLTAYLNGKRIPVRDAVLLLEKFGEEVLAKP